MTPASRFEKRLRTAVESDDFAAARVAADEYLANFRSAPRSLQEAGHASDLFQWAVRTASARRAEIADKLKVLNTIVAGYIPAGQRHTWRVDG